MIEAGGGRRRREVEEVRQRDKSTPVRENTGAYRDLGAGQARQRKGGNQPGEDRYRIAQGTPLG